MDYPRNEFGVPQYPDNDARRLFVLLSAIDLLERPTASALADLTGMERDGIDLDLSRLREQFGVVVHRIGDVYHIDSWGELLRKSGVKSILKR